MASHPEFSMHRNLPVWTDLERIVGLCTLRTCLHYQGFIVVDLSYCGERREKGILSDELKNSGVSTS